VRDQSRCDLRLAKPLDYETRSSFVLTILAENAWTDRGVDTRNVVPHEFVVEVVDAQDTAPYFLRAPPVTALAETASQGDAVLTVEAFDGDYAHPRRLRYAVDPSGRPFSNYFSVDADNGTVYVRRDLRGMGAPPSTPVLLRIVAEELDADGRPAADNGEAARAEVTVAVIVDDVVNRPPKFGQDQ